MKHYITEAVGFKVTFNISVDFLFRVQILQPFQDLSQYCGNLHFIQGTRLQLEEQIHRRQFI